MLQTDLNTKVGSLSVVLPTKLMANRRYYVKWLVACGYYLQFVQEIEEMERVDRMGSRQHNLLDINNVFKCYCNNDASISIGDVE